MQSRYHVLSLAVLVASCGTGMPIPTEDAARGDVAVTVTDSGQDSSSDTSTPDVMVSDSAPDVAVVDGSFMDVSQDAQDAPGDASPDVADVGSDTRDTGSPDASVFDAEASVDATPEASPDVVVARDVVTEEGSVVAADVMEAAVDAAPEASSDAMADVTLPSVLLSRGMPAVQSTCRGSSTCTGPGADPYPASNAFNGRLDDFSHTSGGDPSPWVRVDLGIERRISRVMIWNRLDCCQALLNNYFVEASLDGTTWTVLAANPDVAARPSTHNVSGTGRYVRVRLLAAASGLRFLHPAEIEVYGR